MISPFREGNSEGEYLHVQASGFRAENYRREFSARKNAPVLPSELGKVPGLSKRSDLRRIDTGQKKIRRENHAPVCRPNGLRHPVIPVNRIPRPVTKGHIKGDKSSSLPTLHNYSFFFSSVRQSVPSCPCLSGLFPFPFSFLAFSSFSRRFPTHFRCVFSSLRCNVMTQDVMYILTHCKSIIYQFFSYIFAVTT